MSTSTHITCPNCNHTIELSDALQQQQQEEFDRRLEEATKKATALASEAAERKVRREQSLELERLKRQTTDQEAHIQSLQQKELALLKQESKLKEAVRNQELELERKLSKRLEEKTLSIRKQEEARSSLKEEEYKKQLADQAKLISDLQRKAEQGSMQLQGEVQELVLEDYLRSRFPFDEIAEVKKGARGADIRHLVKDQFGRPSGAILYESKRTKVFSDSWISKLKEDLSQDPADLAVIITEAMPKDLEKSGMYQGVFVCSFADVKIIIPILRQMVQKVALTAATQENKGDKMALLYDYLTGSEFKLKIETILEAFSSMKADLEKEKRAIQRQWKNREKQLDRVLQSTAEMYGDLQGIGGASIPEISQLELPN